MCFAGCHPAITLPIARGTTSLTLSQTMEKETKPMAPIRLRITRWEDVKQQWHKFKARNRVIRATRLDCAFGVTRQGGEWSSGQAGDWLIEEPDGTLNACKHDEFVQIYEPVKKNWPIRKKRNP